MTWTALRITPGRSRDAVIGALFESGSLGIQEDGADVVTPFPPDADIAAILRAVRAADGDAAVSQHPAPDVDVSEWRGSVRAQELGRITIAPPWLAAGYPPESTVIVDPAMAFGTGEHATTRGVVRLLQRLDLRGKNVADLGAGSAVLSIAAVKLGARSAVAIEIDPDAIGNAEENVRANRVADRVSVIEGDATPVLRLVAPVDVILANIISSVLIPMMGPISESLAAGGHAIVSGILVPERESVLAAVKSAGLALAEEDIEGEWWTALLGRA